MIALLLIVERASAYCRCLFWLWIVFDEKRKGRWSWPSAVVQSVADWWQWRHIYRILHKLHFPEFRLYGRRNFDNYQISMSRPTVGQFYLPWNNGIGDWLSFIWHSSVNGSNGFTHCLCELFLILNFIFGNFDIFAFRNIMFISKKPISVQYLEGAALDAG